MTQPKAKADAPKTSAAISPATAAPRRSRPRIEKAPPEPPTAPPAPTTKLETLSLLLQRPQGAKLEELMAATSWQAHSVRGALAGAKVVSEKTDGVRVYRAPQT